MPRDYDDDDDRPRSRRVRDDDDRPRSRRPARDRDEDDDRPRRKSRRDYEEDDYDDRPRRKRRRPKRQEKSVLGMVALVTGIVSVFLAFVPCLGVIAILPGLVGLIMGFIALLLAHKSDGRVGGALPIAGLSVSAFAVIIAAGWLIFFKKVGNDIKQDIAQAKAEMAEEEARHKAEVEKAAGEVKSAQPDSVIRVSAAQFYQAFDQDEDRADAYYRNKIVEVTGVIHEVNFRGEVYSVLLKGGRDEFATVDCHFLKDPAVRAQLSQLTPGRTVTIRGKCLGGFSNLEGCILIQ